MVVNFMEMVIHWDLNGYFLGNGDPSGFEQGFLGI